MPNEVEIGKLEIKIIDGMINKMNYVLEDGNNSYVTIIFNGTKYKSRGSSCVKGEQYPIWNQKFLIPVGEKIYDKNLKFILSVKE